MFAIRSSRQQVRSATRALALGLRNESSASSSAITKSGDAHNGPGGSLTTAQPKEEIIAADVLSDAPPALHYRAVRIYQPTKSTMQSGKSKYNVWKIDWDVLQGAARWENKLMGWGSSADYMQGTSMQFNTKEDAIHFAEKQGWDYQIVKPNKPKIGPKTYADNYLHVPGKLRIQHTK